MYVRMTNEEKKQLRDIVYILNSQEMKTTENELCRIAINFLLENYQADGENSILEKVLKALIA